MGFSQGRLEIQNGFEFPHKKAEKHMGIHFFYGKFGTKTDRTMEFSNSIAGEFGGGADHLIYVSLYIFLNDSH